MQTLRGVAFPAICFVARLAKGTTLCGDARLFADCQESGRLRRVANTTERYERLLTALVDVGAFQDAAEASKAVREDVLPAPGNQTGLYANPDLVQEASVETAFAMLQRWVADGHDIDEMHACVQYRFSDSPWAVAADVLKTQKDLVKVIESHAVPGDAVAVAGEAQPRMRRRVRDV